MDFLGGFPEALLAGGSRLILVVGFFVFTALATRCWSGVGLIPSVALGVGGIATAYFWVGLLGGITRPVLSIIAMVPVMAGVFLVFQRPTRSRMEITGKGMWEGLMAGLLLFAAWHALVTALAPPVLWDVLAYHLAIPKIYVKAGQIFGLPWLLHSHWPHLMEVLYTLPLSWGEDLVPALLHSGFVGCWIVLVFRVGNELGGRKAAWLSAVFVAGQPAVMEIAGTAHSDGAFALFCLSAFVGVWALAEKKKVALSSWVVPGLLIGFGAVSKLYGLIPFATLVLWIAFMIPGSRRERWTRTLVFLSAGLVVAAPWYIRTWIIYGNPVWPFFSRLLGGDFQAAVVENSIFLTNRWGAGSPIFKYGPPFLLIPFVVGVGLSPRIVLSGFSRFLLLMAIPYAVIVGRCTDVWRYFMLFYPALAVAAAVGLSKGWRRGGGIRRTAVVLSVTVGFWPLLTVSQNNDLFAVMHVRSARHPEARPCEVYLERRLDIYRVCRQAGSLMEPGDKVLLFREPRGYYLEPDYLWGDPVNQAVVDYRRVTTVESMRKLLDGHGISHVLVNRGRYQPGENYYSFQLVGVMEEFLAAEAEPLVTDGPVALYRILSDK